MGASTVKYGIDDHITMLIFVQLEQLYYIWAWVKLHAETMSQYAEEHLQCMSGLGVCNH